ncbi:CPXCG motif-containing cysteine-rich protein [Pseudidiomarina terrestris]|uniref:CPXCG motif-containing cysteine-rich protein n=1 Tax=Pseudidiomarina terrestris TaxID=2820060 RepID=A0AAW7QVE4_9GAMM|nr:MULTISPECIES: CPXCG motif-containing cysteine-rich protein [unclassified Pseudidiomarina]MDN7124181.1 CPXCG motif-containing cysteine-rich protein [Pseudidiomarina sp. 1APP75-32.1]MDN7127248.1 CPXCG motif-containing cysteine-rich protein [Pseudidiomarina sp. 1APR75-33.1]MDN7128438.1 CPXCG motif-containing cysteine-rich protein [Pseudidiomarina sp. 1APR75-15]MDN7135314.1 CPXCG motif-containing cysteine-rich protein [Pseudidiomarina sp. 1ASP75-5]MDN7138627.1 CPXCG motif-containing cysteine-ri
MNPQKLHDAAVDCPHCGHHIHLAIDASQGDQDYQDECPACGSDVHIEITLDDVRDKIVVKIRSDDENFY